VKACDGASVSQTRHLGHRSAIWETLFKLPAEVLGLARLSAGAVPQGLQVDALGAQAGCARAAGGP
jgi:hypothetical protein